MKFWIIWFCKDLNDEPYNFKCSSPDHRKKYYLVIRIRIPFLNK